MKPVSGNELQVEERGKTWSVPSGGGHESKGGAITPTVIGLVTSVCWGKQVTVQSKDSGYGFHPKLHT